MYCCLVGLMSLLVVVRVCWFVAQCSLEGYLVDVVIDGDDLLFVEYYCLIVGVVYVCVGLCVKELEMF